MVIINGYPRSGKDTVANLAMQKLSAAGWYSRSISSIDPVRSVLERIGINVNLKGPDERQLLASMKAALEGYDFWVSRSVMSEAAQYLSMYVENRCIFIHVREPKAIQFMRDNKPDWIEMISLYVARPGTEGVFQNDADAGVEDFEYDARIDNDGTLEDLDLKVESFLNLLK